MNRVLAVFKSLFSKLPRLRVPKIVRNIAISVFVLLILLVGGGIGYTYFMGSGEDETLTANTAPVVAKKEPVITPSKPAANAKVGASVQTITSPVAPGENASITVKTLAGSSCKIAVVYNNVPSTDSGLTPKLADEFGIVTWTWTVGSSVPLGKWPVTVTCAFNSRTAVVQGDLIVAKSTAPTQQNTELTQ